MSRPTAPDLQDHTARRRSDHGAVGRAARGRYCRTREVVERLGVSRGHAVAVAPSWALPAGPKTWPEHHRLARGGDRPLDRLQTKGLSQPMR